MSKGLSDFQRFVCRNFDNNLIQGTLNLSTWYTAIQEANKNWSLSNITPGKVFSFVNNRISNVVPSPEEFDPKILGTKITDPSFGKQGIL
jgi:hypothetical protein